MTASSRGSRAAASLIRSSRHPRVCSDCIAVFHRCPSSLSFPATRQRRTYAAAALQSQPAPDPISQLPPSKVASTSSGAAPAEYITKSGLLLSRPPILTKTLTPFEKAFFFYQKRLNERLVMPFSRYFYFKKDTPADADWKLKAKERGGAPARELGGYDAYGDEGWNDELLVGDRSAETNVMVEKLVKDSEVRAVEGRDGKAIQVEEGQEGVHEGAKVERPMGRWTKADEAGDMKRLDRRLGETLYLVVKRAGGGWGFPAGMLEGKENLHQAAERVLVQTAGINMNTWIIGNVPFGHHIKVPRSATAEEPAKAGERTFFMKARIMAGQASLEGNLFGLEDFKWLTKDEVRKHVSDRYYRAIKNMLADR